MSVLIFWLCCIWLCFSLGIFSIGRIKLRFRLEKKSPPKTHEERLDDAYYELTMSSRRGDIKSKTYWEGYIDRLRYHNIHQYGDRYVAYQEDYQMGWKDADGDVS